MTLNKDDKEELAFNILDELNFTEKLSFDEMEQVLKFALKHLRSTM